MKYYCFILCLLLLSCNKKIEDNNATAEVAEDSMSIVKKELLPSKVYSNQRFQDVTVTKVTDGNYHVEGKGQIFEAAFSWVVEDGHNEIKKGHGMTDAGAPEWGKFSFDLEVQKARENSTLTLLLFESSAKDGSRQHELPIVLN
ncbi:MAG: Gmad2 immunoglobulin-like domain-containing protein [Flavisolibacter sp.]|nr:Gmad2 immunoglobulin-like domain-containing protein [Flavisolibacter sp.]